MESEADAPCGGGEVLAVGESPNGIHFAHAEDIAYAYTHLGVGAAEQVAVAPREFEIHEFVQAAVANARDEVEEHALPVPERVEREPPAGAVLQVVHQREAVGVEGIRLVALEMVEHGIWHVAEDISCGECPVEGAAHAQPRPLLDEYLQFGIHRVAACFQGGAVSRPHHSMPAC